MPSNGVQTPLGESIFARLAAATRYVIAGVAPDSWFGPQQPLAPMAPPEVKGRQFDYPFGVNLNYSPRSSAGISFAELRALADALPLLRAVIETRKDQIAGLNYTVRARARGGAVAPARVDAALAFLARPDRRHSFAAWLRMLIEDMLVIDAATIYPRFDRAGALYSLDIVDGATITPLVGEDGRSPEPPDPAFQQILHGVPAADFALDELLYLPRNPRAHRLYGMSPVEQIALTINIALRRDAATLEYYRSGSSPDAFATLPKEWTVDQIRQFQDYFDALMSGNSARRRMTKFMPSDFKLIEARQPPLKDMYDEWLARVICYAFSVPASPFVSQVNRATSETMRLQAAQEGLVPLKSWLKSALDQIIQVYLGEPDLEFVWVGDDAVDPLQQAQTLNILVGAGIKTREEARAELGLGAEGMGGAGLGKWNFDPLQPRDENGRWTAEGAVESSDATKPPLRMEGLQVAALDSVATDVVTDGGSATQIATSEQSKDSSNPDPVLGQRLSDYLRSQMDTPRGVELVIHSEKERLKSANPAPSPIDWVRSLGITDEGQILAYLSTAPATDILAANSLRGSPSADVIVAVKKYGALYGFDPQTLLDIIAFETGGTFDPNSKNPGSSASGLFQIMGPIWHAIAQQYHLNNVFDVDQNVLAGVINLMDIRRTLTRNGISDPSEEQLYFAHQQGGGGAAVLLANPDMNAIDALNLLQYYNSDPGSAADAIKRNGGSNDMTARQFFTFTTARFRATAVRTPRISGE